MKRFTIILIAGILASCAFSSNGKVDRPDPRMVGSNAFAEARELYDRGHYVEALEKFRLLATTGETDTIVFNAKLGDICCQLMLAATPSEHYAAIAMWNELGKSTSESSHALDFRMIDPVIVHLTMEQVQQKLEIDRINASKKEMDEQPEKMDKQPEKMEAENQEMHAELSALRKKVKKADDLQRQLETLEAENKSLKEKIKALEAIDQNIQKKKTEIESPGEYLDE